MKIQCIILFLTLFYHTHAQVPYWNKPHVKSSIEILVPLTPLTAYDVSSDGHSIVIRQSSYDGIVLSEGGVVFDHELPRGVIWEDIKFRVHMGSLYITIPTYYPHIYPIASVSEKGEVVAV